MYFSRFFVRSFAILSLFISTQVFADCYKNYKAEIPCRRDIMVVPCPRSQFLLDGFYLGGQVGYDSYWVRENISLPTPADLSGNPKINAPNWVEGLFAGYGHYFNAFYLGAEVFGNYSQASESYSLSNAAGTYSSKIETRWSAGVSLLPGYGMTDTTLIYARLGYNWVSLKSTETVASLSGSRTSTVSGPNYGVGLETLIVDNWSVRGEYTHTNYSSFSSELGTNFDASDNQFMAGIVYHFAC